MTPAEQRGLPLLVLESALRPSRRRILEDQVLPVLAAATIAPDRANVHQNRWVPGVRLTIDAKAVVGDAQVRPEIHVTTHSLDTISPGGVAIGGDPRVDALRAVDDLVRRILNAPTVEDPPEPPSVSRVVLSALRMREAVGSPHEEDDAIDLHYATPLGTGGASTWQGPGGTGDHHLVDVSPEVCIPGPVSIDVRSGVVDTLGVKRFEIVIGARVRRQRFTPIDPIERMRMEAEGPWDPSRMYTTPAGRPSA